MLGNCALVKNDTPAKSEQWASPRVLRWFALLKSISAGQDANSRVGTRRGAQESFLHLFRGMYVCVVCWLDFYLIHMVPTKKSVQNSENLQKIQAGSISILYIIESCYQNKWLSEESKTSVL